MLNSKLETNGTIVYLYDKNGNKTSDYWGYIFKKDNIVWLTITAPAAITIAADTWQTVAKLDTKYRPNREVALFAACYQTINSALNCFINKDGEVKIYNPTSSTVSYFRCGGMWFTD